MDEGLEKIVLPGIPNYTVLTGTGFTGGEKQMKDGFLCLSSCVYIFRCSFSGLCFFGSLFLGSLFLGSLFSKPVFHCILYCY